MGQRGSPEMLQELVDREERLPEPAGRAHPRVWEPGLGRCEQTEIDPVQRRQEAQEGAGSLGPRAGVVDFNKCERWHDHWAVFYK